MAVAAALLGMGGFKWQKHHLAMASASTDYQNKGHKSLAR
jgi:hypothetical protein